MVILRVYGMIRVLAGRDEISVDASSPYEVLKKACEMLGMEAERLVFDKSGKVYPSMLVSVNDTSISNLDAPISKNSIVHLIPAVEGG
jgi:molybdopterin converting factor small subunit